jgi:hypothetical protein
MDDAETEQKDDSIQFPRDPPLVIELEDLEFDEFIKQSNVSW